MPAKESLALVPQRQANSDPWAEPSNRKFDVVIDGNFQFRASQREAAAAPGRLRKPDRLSGETPRPSSRPKMTKELLYTTKTKETTAAMPHVVHAHSLLHCTLSKAARAYVRPSAPLWRFPRSSAIWCGRNVGHSFCGRRVADAAETSALNLLVESEKKIAA
jgi:hypothetical protein